MVRGRRGQSVLEYAVIIAVVVGALLAINIYMKRGLENRMRQSGDDVGKQFAAGATQITRNTTHNSLIVETTEQAVTTTNTERDASTFQGIESVGNFNLGL